jgi:hypothetical protein
MPSREPPREPSASSGQPADRGPVLQAVEQAVDRLRYGTVQLTIHDGRIVQLDVTERQRFS